MLQVDISTFSYSEKITLQNIQFTLEQGKHLSILGESGSGKSTLLHIIYGLQHLENGTVFYNDKQLLGPKFNLIPGEPFMKLVAQEFNIMPFTTVSENIGTHLSRQDKSKDENRIQELLEIVGLSEFSERKVNTLSGGQKQRVTLAKALAKEPKVLLLDEPFSNIDAFQKNTLRRNLFQYLQDKKITCICATHDSEEALTFSDAILILKNGKMNVIGNPIDIYKHPKNKYQASFFGDVNVLPSRLISEENSSEEIIIHPHQLQISEEKVGFPVIISNSYFRGKDYLIKAKWQNQAVFFEHFEALKPTSKYFLKLKKHPEN